MGIETTAVASAIAELVAGGQVLGTDLARHLRERYPDWTPSSVGARNLKQFIDTSVEAVDVVRRSGLDVVYGLRGSAVPAPRTVEPTSESVDVGSQDRSANLWRVWVSPGSPLAIAVNRHTGELSAVRRDGAAPDHIVVIEPPDRSVHRAIAHRFIIDVATSDAAALGAIIDGGDEDWWRQWNDRLSAVGLLERWRRYRSAAFESRLVEALRSRQLDDDLVDAAVASALTQRASTSANGKTRQSWLRVNCSDRAQLERVLRKVLGQMSINDLRDISVPIGLVLDAVEAD